MATLTPWLDQKFYLANGTTPNAGGLIFTYEPGTTTKKTTYVSESGAANTNPIILNSAGECNLWLGAGGYKIVNAPANDTDPPAAAIKTWDDVNLAGASGNDVGIVDSVAALRDLDEGAFTMVQVLGHDSANGVGPGLYRWDSTSTAAGNDGTIVAPALSDGTGRWILTQSAPVKVSQFGASGAGTPADTAALIAAYSSFGSSIGRIIIDVPVALGSIISIPSNITIEMVDGGYFDQGAYTLAFAGQFIGGQQKWFYGTGAVSFSKVKALFPQWWGAKGDGPTTDDTAAIQMAIDALPNYTDFVFPSPSSYYRISSLEIANKQGCRFFFGPGADTALPAYTSYPLRYSGAGLTTYENPMMRIVGCVRCDFHGLALDGSNLVEYGLWFSGLNNYTGTAPITEVYQRSIGCRFYSFATTRMTKCGGQVGENTSTSSQTDLFTFHNSFFAVAESATQTALDAQPTTFGLKADGANTYGNFDHCQFTGDYGIYCNSGSYHFNRPYLLGDAGLYVNAKTCDVTMVQPYAEGLIGRPVWLDTGDATDAKNINIIGAKFFPGSKSTATIDSVADVDAATDIITETAHGFVTGDILAYSNGGGTSIGGLTTGSKYWAIRASANGFKVAASLANAQAGTAVDISDGVGVSHTFTWQPPPMRYQSNMNVSVTGSFIEGWITDNAGSTGQKPIYIDHGNIWLHPTDYSANPDIRLSLFSTSPGASAAGWLRQQSNMLRQVINETAAPATMGAAWSGVDVYIVNSASGNTYTLAAAYKGMSVRVWKLGSGTAIVNDAASGGSIMRGDTGAAVATDVRASSTTEQGFIQFDCIDDGYWRCTSRMSLSYDSGTLTFAMGAAPQSDAIAGTGTRPLQSDATGLISAPLISSRSAITGITASTTQAQGQGALTTDQNYVSTCANANDTVTLPAAAVGYQIYIRNNGAQTLQIFPASGDAINGAAVNASITLAAGASITLRTADTTNWYS